jgi:hypothetical protein
MGELIGAGTKDRQQRAAEHSRSAALNPPGSSKLIVY